jgi:hypothetical protein
MLVILLGVLCAMCSAQIAPKDFIPTYKCSFCLATMDAYFASTEASPSLWTSCLSLFPESICKDMDFDKDLSLPVEMTRDSRAVCGRMEKCPVTSSLPQNTPVRSVNNVDIRVSKALGSRGYDKVRISAISNVTVSSPLFDYQSQFKYRWTDKFLSTGVVTVKPGQKTKFTIAGNEVSLLYSPGDVVVSSLFLTLMVMRTGGHLYS